MQNPPWSKLLLEYINEQEDTKVTFKNQPQQLNQGVQTTIYKIQLDSHSYLSQPLVLRIYKEHALDNIAQIEGITQNYLNENNYPVPKAHYICTDSTILGTPFLIMDYIKGDQLTGYSDKAAPTIAEYMIRLHKIDPEPLRNRFKSASIEVKHTTGLETLVEFLESKQVTWLDPAIEWLQDNKPPSDSAVVHDDLHAMNILMHDGKVSGVIDWSGLIDDRLRDVGSTVVLYNVMAPCNNPGMGREYGERVKIFLEHYSSVFSVDPWKLEYFEVVRCFRVMVGYVIGFEGPIRVGMHKATYGRFNEITGISLTKPW